MLPCQCNNQGFADCWPNVQRHILVALGSCRLVENNPEVLNIAAFKKTLQHAKEVMGPNVDVIDTLKRRPDMIFQFQQGKDLIPYDEVPTQH